MEILAYLLIVSAVLSILALITNPFSAASIITLPYRVTISKKGTVVDDASSRLSVRQGFLWRAFAVIKSGTHIMHTRYVHSKRSNSSDVDEVIKDIHTLRYDPNKLLLISGDHFSGLFVRNLGVFLYPVMDRSFGIDEKDWHDRQITYLQTVAYALATYAKYETLTTTIMPTSRLGATCVNFYAYPSDTLYGIFYALATTTGVESGRPYDYAEPLWDLNIGVAAKDLLIAHTHSLKGHYTRYRATVFDEKTLLIKKSVHLSGAKDITKRTCAFYDNVIFWKTTQLAMKLGIIPWDKVFLAKLKQTILDAFWLEDAGHFLEDQSEIGLKNQYYSSDWLIVLATGFLDPFKKSERVYYERTVEYIRQTAIDLPFPIKYHADTRADRQFLAVRIAVASYGGDAIWSFWGMEYIKVLYALGKTGKTAERDEYYQQALRHIDSYERAMLKYGGFPEVYDAKGALLKTRLYQSICQTSWVIGFEQVRSIRDSFIKNQAPLDSVPEPHAKP